MNFEFEAYDAQGQLVTGNLQAVDGDEVMAHLRAQGYFPLTVEEAPAPAARRRRSPWTARDIAVFARQFAVMLNTGMPVVECLQVLALQQPKALVQQALQNVRRAVAGGRSLGAGLAEQLHVFPEMFVNMVQVGEESGNLPEILNRMAAFYQQEAKLRGDIKQATTYPAVVVLFALAAIAVVMFVLLPGFADMFDEMGVELPLITRLILAFRDFFVDNLLFVLPAAALMIWLLSRYLRSPAGSYWRDGWLLRLPIIGDILSKIVFARFARTLGLLFSSGLSMVDALANCEKIVGNTVVAADIAWAREGVQRGEGIAEPLRTGAEAFPPMLVEIIAVGEETGGLDEVLTQISDFYDSEVEQVVKGLTSIIEPVVMVILGGIVFIIVLSVFVPIFNMVDVIQ